MNNTRETAIDVTSLSEEEKYQYYIEWKKSGLKAVDFCKAQQLSFIHFRYWCKGFKSQEAKTGKIFLPITVIPEKEAWLSNASNIRKVNMRLPNEFQKALKQWLKKQHHKFRRKVYWVMPSNIP